MIRMLLTHNARDRPSSKELIRKYLPPKMEEADFNHVSVYRYIRMRTNLPWIIVKMLNAVCMIVCSLFQIYFLSLPDTSGA